MQEYSSQELVKLKISGMPDPFGLFHDDFSLVKMKAFPFSVGEGLFIYGFSRWIIRREASSA